MIAVMEEMPIENGAGTPFLLLLGRVMAALPDLGVPADQVAALETVSLKGDPALLEKAMETVARLAASFSRDKHSLRVKEMAEEGFLHLRFDLDALPLSIEQAADFFRVESSVRSASYAEPLGLAPVVAHMIFSALGGGMRMVKGEGRSGYLEVTIQTRRPRMFSR